jgi:hypothetical protein
LRAFGFTALTRPLRKISLTSLLYCIFPSLYILAKLDFYTFYNFLHFGFSIVYHTFFDL